MEAGPDQGSNSALGKLKAALCTHRVGFIKEKSTHRGLKPWLYSEDIGVVNI